MIRIAIISSILVLASCTRNIERVPKPDGLIPRSKMVTVIKDMMILESHIQANYGQVGTYYKVMQRSGDSLLTTFNLDRETFEASMDYYGSRQDKMKKIYADALEQMNEELGNLETE